MHIKEIESIGVKVVEHIEGEDNRGKSAKIYDKDALKKVGIDFTPLEMMTIHSKKDVLRGIHYQREYGQSKLIKCLFGKLYVVIVKLDGTNSWGSTILYDNNKMIYIPEDCAVGTLALEDTDFILMCGNYYFMKDYECGIAWDNRDLSIDWIENKESFIISEKDRHYN